MKLRRVKLKRWIQVILVSGGVIGLFACSSAHKKANDEAAINDANAAYNAKAQASGLGEESNFGGEEGSGKMLSKRVYYFDFDSDVVHEEDKPAIDTNAEYLLAHSKIKAMLEGHTDPRGSREYNIGLGERRAKAIAEMLTEKGINPAKVRIVSYGAQKLAVPGGHTEGDYQLDRRVVLVYLQR